MIKIRDIAWLAGLLEGEGTFVWPWRKECMYWTNCAVQIQMTDRDVLEKAAKLMNKKVGGPYIKVSQNQRKPIYRVTWKGKEAIQIMMTIYPFMGERRQGKIRQIINNWRVLGSAVHPQHIARLR